MATSSITLLSRLDLQSPFVTVSVDSERVNVTFKAIVAALSSLQSALDQANETIQRQAAESSAMRRDLETQRDRTNSLEKRVALLDVLEKRVAETELRMSEFAEGQTALKTRQDAVEDRLRALEKLRRDDQELIQKIAEDAQKMHREAAEAVATTNSRVDQLASAVSNVHSGIAGTQSDLNTLIQVFEIDMNNANVAVAQKTARLSAPQQQTVAVGVSYQQQPQSGVGKPSSERVGFGAKEEFSETVSFCLDLPSFATLRNELKKFVLDEVAAIKQALNQKADVRDISRLQEQIDGCLRATKAAAAMAERAANDAADKVPKGDFLAAIKRLETTKADVAALMGLVTGEDLRVLRDAMAQLRDDVQKYMAEQQLENRELRLRTPAPQPAFGLQQALDQLADLLARVKELEKTALRLDDVKADRTELAALQRYIEDSMANFSLRRDRPQSGGGRRTPTPTDALMAMPQRRLLSPISRPASATIPESYRMPNEPLYYTSLPVRPDSPHSRADHSGASAQLFDSNGMRTTATLSQGKSVPAAEHYENMRRVVAGEVEIPEGFEIHEIPM